MKSDLTTFDPEAFPSTLPIFPLSGALLLPWGQLSLHVFEPRYINLVEAALANSRLVGMVQMKDPDHETGPDDAANYDVGCAGRISSFTEAENGQLQIILTGLLRFRIVGELPLYNGFRSVTPNYLSFANDLNPCTDEAVNRDRLVTSFNAFADAHGLNVDEKTFAEAPDEAIITSLSMSCPFKAQEKQALLECQTLTQRCDLLTALLEMAVRSDDIPTPNIQH